MFYRIARIIIMPIVAFLRPTYFDKEKVNQEKGAAIVFSNHISTSDPLVLSVMFKRTLHYMAKQELFESKLLGWLFRGLQAFPVNRKQVDIKTVRNALDVLKKGEMFAIFPEGTRNRTGELMPLKQGSAFIALKAQAHMIPVYIHRPRPWKRVVIVGDSIDVAVKLADVPKEAQLDALMKIMQNALIALQLEVFRRLGHENNQG